MPVSLCHVDDIPEGGSVGFDLPQAKIFAIKKNSKVYLYLNRCPHLGMSLNWQPDQFLDPEGSYIQCASHGALFLIEDGECIRGPCKGQDLWQLDYILEDGQLSIDEEELPEQRQPV